MNIAICDDDDDVISFIENYLVKSSLKNTDIESFYSGKELIRYLKSNDIIFNIYFLDIEIEGYNGIETASMIREQDKKALIIFVTNHKDYVYKVFEVLPFRFLVKPLNEDKLSIVVKEALEHISSMKQIFIFNQDRIKTQVFADEILYFECRGRKINLYTEKKIYEFYGKMYDIYERLDKELFLKIHASFIINMEYISSFKVNEIILKSGISLPISNKYKNDVKEQYFTYIERRGGK